MVHANEPRRAARGLSLRCVNTCRYSFSSSGDFAPSRGHEEFRRHTDERCGTAGGVVAQGISQRLGHEARIAGGGEQMLEAGQELFTGGDAGGETGTDPRTQGDELLATQFVEEPRITREDHTQQRLRVEAGAREQPRLTQTIGVISCASSTRTTGRRLAEPR